MATGSAWIFFLFLPCAVVIAQSACRPPLLTIEPQPTVYFAEGGYTVLRCAARGNPLPTYEWRRNGKVLKLTRNEPRVTQMRDNGTLVFSNTQARDVGIYQCFVRNDFGVTITIKASLEKAVLEDFKSSPAQTHNLKLGDSFSLPCKPPLSVPKGDVMWVIRDRQGGFGAAEIPGRVVMDGNYNLLFSNIKLDDELDLPYACIVVNGFLRVNTMGPSHYIRVTEDAEEDHQVSLLWASPRNITAMTGPALAIKCIFGGNPTPEVIWQRLDSRIRSTRVTINRHELIIKGVQPEDAGRYQCLAQNSLSTARESETFTVKVEGAPSFTRRPQNLQTGVGGMVQFFCQAKGIPRPTIDWIVNGNLLTDSSSDLDLVKRVNANTIHVEELDLKHSMVVQCNATNAHGSVVTRAFICVTTDAPEIIQPPKPEVVIAMDKEVNLTCKTSSPTDQRIRWLKDGFPVQDSRYTVLPNGDLNINTVTKEDEGMFKCEARNQLHMTSSREGKLTVCNEDECPSGATVVTSQLLLHATSLVLALSVCLKCLNVVY